MSRDSRRLLPPTIAASQSLLHSAVTAKCRAHSEEEQVVSIDMLGALKFSKWLMRLLMILFRPICRSMRHCKVHVRYLTELVVKFKNFIFKIELI